MPHGGSEVRRRIVFFGVGVGIALGAAFACGFPSPDFAPDDGFGDGSVVDGELTEASAPAVDASDDGTSCKGDPICDCDGDGDLALSCDGGDCDDHDERVRSTQTQFIDAVSGRQGDWNCDGVIEFEVEAGIVCSKLLDGGPRDAEEVAAACAREGFTEPDVGCGAEGLYVVCEPAKQPNTDPLTCRTKNGKPNDYRARACR